MHWNRREEKRIFTYILIGNVNSSSPSSMKETTTKLPRFPKMVTSMYMMLYIQPVSSFLLRSDSESPETHIS